MENIVQMLTEQETPSPSFIQKLLEFDVFSSEELLEKADEGTMDRKGEIEFVHSPSQRLIMYLILASRLSNGESFSHFQDKFISAIEWALGYMSERLLEVLFCAYDYSPIRESIWGRVNSSKITFWGRTLSLGTIVHSLENVSFFPKNMQEELKQVVEQLEKDLQNTDDKDISVGELEEVKEKIERILQKENYPLPPKLPAIGTFLAKYTGR
ncbi:hypothetical protein [Raineya sp.]|jgi:hypothetical protein